ncbi:MAG: short-chain dehydrogenase [Anaerolineaceae bacterium]|nr:short-chain dehydrogenase [Anaerolineaceae bacterium]
MKVDNKVIVVTGGGNGIGRELVLLLLKKGAKVAAVDINEAALLETVKLAGDKQINLSTHIVNIANREEVEALPDKVIAAHGTVDGLINNAGIIQKFVHVNELEYKEIERVININLYGVIFMTKAFLPHLLQRPEGHIVNISSMGGFLPVPGQTLYGASKAAVKLFTEGLNSELLDTNVRVTVVFPGAIGTNIAANSGVGRDMGEAKDSPIKMTFPSVAAQTIVDGMEKNSYRVLIGSDAKMMDFLSRLNPKQAAKLIYKQMQSIVSN